MEAQKGRLFWFRKPKDEKDLLIFWAGDPLGSLYIYEFKESLPAQELKSLIQKHNRECWIWELGHSKTIYSAGEWDLLERYT